MATRRCSWCSLFLIVAVSLAAAPALADTLFVPSEYATIQAAIDAADPNDVVEIADGTYAGVGNKDLDFGGKAITVRSASGDASTCIIDCEGEGRGFYFRSGEGANSVVQDLTISNGSAIVPLDGLGGGVYCLESSPTLRGCTIRGNLAGSGGGFCCSLDCSPTLTDCSIYGNEAVGHGGGVLCGYHTSPTLTNCTISGNVSGYGRGSGMYSEGSDLTLTDCVIAGNEGGGVYCNRGDATLTDCTISENSSSGSGGGLNCSGTTVLLTNCTISGNSASGYGGGIRADYGSLTLITCAVSGNEATHEGGGVYCDRDCSLAAINTTIGGNRTAASGGGVYCDNANELTLTNCEISGNSAEDDGGGVYCWYDVGLVLTSCLISGNAASGEGGGIYCDDYNTLTLTNCTIGGNLAGDDGGGVHCYYTNSLTLANCIVWDNLPQALYIPGIFDPVATYSNVEGGSGQNWFGTGCIDTDPLFVDPGYWDDGGTPADPNDDSWIEGDYRLAAGSPCIDAGDNTAVPTDAFDLDDDGDVAERTPWDLDLLPRFFDDPDTTDSGVADLPDYPDVVDMGAYEFRGSVCVGDLDGDDDVDLADLQILLSNYGQSGMSAADGDMDDDGDIDLADLQVLLSQYGRNCD